MKQSVIAISLLIAFMGVVTHGIIPHHHHDMVESELVSHHHESENLPGDADHHDDDPLPCPDHQHLFEVIQTSSVSAKVVHPLLFCFFSSKLGLSTDRPVPPGKITNLSFTVHFTSFISLPPNSLRGSPFIA